MLVAKRIVSLTMALRRHHLGQAFHDTNTLIVVVVLPHLFTLAQHSPVFRQSRLRAARTTGIATGAPTWVCHHSKEFRLVKRTGLQTAGRRDLPEYNRIDCGLYCRSQESSKQQLDRSASVTHYSTKKLLCTVRSLL